MQGTVIDGRYSVVRTLGNGGMADVYLAHDDILDRDVALKVLRGQFARDEHLVERFEREARSAASLSHPNIVSVYDRGETEDGTAYIAMEHVTGGTLEERISREGPLQPGEAARLALQVAQALGAAHHKGVVHRDIKPHNVLLTASGDARADAKVTDFGIARAVSTAPVTRSNLVIGTASYMSPEQALGKPLDHRTDLYSLGVTLYETLTGELPHAAESSMAVSLKHVNETPRPPGTLNPAIPEDLNAVVMKLLAKDPDDRYHSASGLARDLGRVRDGLPLAPANPARTAQVPHASGPAPVRRRKRRRGLRGLLALVLVLLAVLGTGWALSQPFHGFQPRDVLGDLDRLAGAEVPSLEGLARREAQRRLEEAGFGTEVRQRGSSAGEAGTVLEQSPAAGERAGEGSTVTLTIGSGTVEVPEVVGSSKARAETRLEEAGLTVGSVREDSSEFYTEGTVFEQGYPAGTPVEPGTDVNIGISTGPPPAPVPAEEPARSTTSPQPTAEPEQSVSPTPRAELRAEEDEGDEEDEEGEENDDNRQSSGQSGPQGRRGEG